MSILHARGLDILRQLAAQPDDTDELDLLVDGWRCYFGIEPIHRRTFNELVMCGAVKRLWEDDDCKYWIITWTGRAIARRPELADEYYETVMTQRGAFSIIDDRIVPLDR